MELDETQPASEEDLRALKSQSMSPSEPTTSPASSKGVTATPPDPSSKQVIGLNL